MDFLELQKFVERRARHLIPPTTIKEVLNRKLRDLTGLHKIPMFLTKFDFPTVATQLFYDLAENIRLVNDVRHRENDTVPLDVRLFQNRVRSRTVPFRQIIDQEKVIDSKVNKLGNLVELFSDPGTRTVAAKDNFELFAFRHPKKMVNSADIPEFPLLFHDLIGIESVVELHEDKFGSSPLEGKRQDRMDLYEGTWQKEPDEDFPDRDIVYSPEFVITRRSNFNRDFFIQF